MGKELEDAKNQLAQRQSELQVCKVVLHKLGFSITLPSQPLIAIFKPCYVFT